MRFEYLEDKNCLRLDNGTEVSFGSPEAFSLISKAWLRVGWDTKYVYGFSWMGRPIIQLPEDLIRVQEVIYQIQPDVIIETGVAHGGSLVFYATLLNAIGKGKVVGVDVEIRNHNRVEIEKHKLSKLITLIEADSVSDKALSDVAKNISEKDTVMVILDSNHTKEHVLAELNAYSRFVTQNSYVVVCDGIMASLPGAPRTLPGWDSNNPLTAMEEFLSQNKNFKQEEPDRDFNEGEISERVTYWPNAYLRRLPS